jgi:RimJ/RimL family protein N-acetyltransferase
VTPVAELRTERLVLRAWRPEDLAPFAALNDDPAVMEHFPHHLTREQSDAMVERITRFIDEQGWGLWAVEVADSGEFVGFTGLSVPRFEAHFTPCVEVGWRLARSAWGHGHATEAAAGAVAHGFGSLALDEIVAMVAPDNVRSQGVMRKLGMTRDEGADFDHPLVPEGSPVRRHRLYRLTRADWEGASGRS